MLEEIRRIWMDVLNVKIIDNTDDFFKIGGDSNSVFGVLATLKDDFDITVPLTTLFNHRTLEDFSNEVSHLMEEEEK